jgi:putative membrane protein
MYEGHWFGGGFMWLFWILIVAVLLWGLKAVVGGEGGARSSEMSRSALDILQARYARGEIDQEEFNKRKRDILG